MINSFDTDVAMDVGINAAIIYKNIQYWCEKNQANELNFHDGLYWTFNSVKAFCVQFPYMTEKQIRSSLNILEEKGYIASGNFNKSTYDRTKWYADKKAKMGNSICLVGQMDNDKKANGNAQEGEPIPNINTNINTNDMDIYIVEKPKSKRFVPPTIEEVREYCEDRNNLVDPEKFVNYYSSNGWMVGKHKMVDWKAAIRTWERNSYSTKSTPKRVGNEFTELLEQMGDDYE